MVDCDVARILEKIFLSFPNIMAQSSKSTDDGHDQESKSQNGDKEAKPFGEQHTEAKCRSLAVDPNCYNPDAAWHIHKKNIKLKTIEAQKLSPIDDNKLRFVCISDTHGMVEDLQDLYIPGGDVLLHAGDFTLNGTLEELLKFNTFLGTLPHRHKIVIAGNHERVLDMSTYDNGTKFSKYLKQTHGVTEVCDLLTNCIYLQDDMVTVAGVTIYGSPWTPEFACMGFSLPRGKDMLEKWKLIPDNVDILMTHGPPVGIGDRVKSTRSHVGCVDLLNTVHKRVKPKYHVFGHIHEGHGMYTDGTTTFVNASICTKSYKPTNSPYVLDMDIPTGSTKTSPCGLKGQFQGHTL